MPLWEKILYALGLVVLAIFLFMTIRNNPQWFTKENFSKSSYTLAILALFLIAVVGMCVLLLRH
ncbi:MAG: hypothetical protein KIT27_08080 [Legionellales bacterium]|nr:hypothetical protein [Legionellales bacterium]